MPDLPQDESIDSLPKRPVLLGPKRRWWWFFLWVSLQVTVLVVQRSMVFSFPTGYWTPNGFTDSTPEELLWYRLPIAGILLLAVIFVLGLRWWVPEKGTRGILRAWGLLLTLVSIAISIGMSLYFSWFYFYMD
jgi:hypothetical protein